MVKNLLDNAGDIGDVNSIPGLGRFPWGRKWQPTPVFLPREFHGQRSLVGYGAWATVSPWGHKELDTTEHTCNRERKSQMIFLKAYRESLLSLSQNVEKPR